MPIALFSYALLTVEDARTFLKVGTTTEETELVTDLVNRATDYCEWYCNRALKARAFTDLRLAAQASPVLRMRATPIDTAAAVTIALDAVAQTVWRTEADGDPALKDVIVGADVPGEPSHFWRGAGWPGGSSSNPYPIRLTYTGGFTTIPGQLRDAAMLVVANLFNAQERKMTDIQSLGQGPVTPAVSFRGELIPMKAKQILDSYRVSFA